MKYSARNLGGAAAILLGALPVHAHAQDTGAENAVAAEAPEAPGQTAEEDDSSGNILVTARRRSERLQDVPIALTAITGDALEAAGITGTDELAAVTPGLVFTSSLHSATPFLRGVGTPDSSAGAEASIATYVDGIYYPSMPGTVLALPNIERVEVLKGPQGTLFGRNATGGLIQVITRDPPANLRGRIMLGYGNYETIEGSLYVGGPLGENVGADISGYLSNQNDGWGTNANTGAEAYRTNEHQLAAKIVYNNGVTSIRLAADYSHRTSDSPGNFTFLEGALSQGGFRSVGPYDPLGTFPVSGNVEQYGTALTIRHDAGPVRLTSLTSIRRLTGFLSQDQDSTNRTASHVVLDLFDRSFTQEFQIASNGTGPVQWIAGAFYMSREAGYDPIVVRNATGIATSTVDEQQTESLSGFGEVTWEFMPRTHVTAGLRYTSDQQTIHGEVTRPAGVTIQDGEERFNEATWRLILDHRVLNGPLLYVSYNRGFRSGLFNLVSPGPLNLAVRPEILDAFEAGFKWDIVPGVFRLNSSLFHYRYKDIQLNQVVAGGARTLNAASAQITGLEIETLWRPAPGVSLQGGAVWLPKAEYTSFPGAPLSTPLPAGGNVQGSFIATGNRMIRTSRLTLNLTGNYEFDVGTNSAAVGFSYYYNSGFFFEPDNRTRQEPYHLLNAHVSYTWERHSITARLWARNILDELYYVQVSESAFGDRGRPAAPRTYGFSLEKRF